MLLVLVNTNWLSVKHCWAALIVKPGAGLLFTFTVKEILSLQALSDVTRSFTVYTPGKAYPCVGLVALDTIAKVPVVLHGACGNGAGIGKHKLVIGKALFVVVDGKAGNRAFVYHNHKRNTVLTAHI